MRSSYGYDAGNLPKGKDSVFYKSGKQPDPKKEVKQKDGCAIPMGPFTGTGGWGANELVVYNIEQIQMKYLLRCKF